MTTTFPRTTPSALGIDARGIESFVEALESTPGVEPHGFVLLRHGRVAAEAWWHPYTADRPHLLYSLSKSFTAAAVGFAVDEGLVDLDATVLSYFPELDAEVTDERSRRIRVRHLLSMASGHREDTVHRAEQLDPTNTVRGFLLLPPEAEPGTLFTYNQPCTYTLGAIVRRVSGGSLVDWLRPRLLDPLGITDFAWKRDATGAEFGFSGAYATTESIARLGQLYLQRGVWDGVRLLSEEWVAAATRAQVPNPDEPEPDWRQGYGFQFWMARHGFRGDGAYGQFCVVLPEHDVVLAVTGQTPDMQAVLDAAWTHLLPAFDSPDASVESDTGLEARLASTALAPVTGRSLDDAAVASGALPDTLPGTLAGAYAPVPAAPDDLLAVPTLKAATLSYGGDAASAWELALDDAGERLTIPVGQGEWAVDGPTAASGAVTDDGTVAVDVRFVETPHLLHLRFDVVARSVEARWETFPLHDTPASLRRPAG